MTLVLPSGTIRRRSAGFSLIEVLVTLVVVSVATLGMAGMQTLSLRANGHALMETQAATLAQDIIERIRANPAADYTIEFNEEIEAAQVPNCKGAAANCDSQSMARYDLLEWKCSLGAASLEDACEQGGVEGRLPDADGSIVVAGNVHTIAIRWFDATSESIRSMTFTMEI